MFFFGRVSLEKQIKILADIGVRTNVGVSIDDLLISFPRTEFERKPYDLVLFTLGIEIEARPFGRHISDDAWNFDLECIDGPGSYMSIIENLTRIAKRPNLISGIVDEITPDAPAGVLRYSINGAPRALDVEVRHDWADAMATAIVMGEIADAICDGRRFWGVDNGQASVVFFLTDQQAARISRLTKNHLSLICP